MNAEEWKQVPGFEGLYEVSNLGRVRGVDRILTNGSRWKGKIIQSKSSNSGHMSVRLCDGGVHKFVGVHRLVLTAFVGPCPDGMEGCHYDGDPSHNLVGNLRWDTPAGNASDRVRHGTDTSGERNGLARLTECDVRQIRALGAAGTLGKHIAARMGVTPANVSSILNRKTWKHIEVDGHGNI